MIKRRYHSYLLISTMMAGLMGVNSGAWAQDAVDDPAQEAVERDQVVVTGSRIKKKDFVSNSPITTVGEVELQETGTINTEDLLNTLPQTVPGFGKTSNNPGDGTASVDLRGLGSTRTLVLMNGTRMVPTSKDGIVDINNIPPSMIKSVEVVTGGASAIYGSDAIGGVVNFILKDDFEGMETRLNYDISQEGDAENYDLGFTVGSGFAEGRGHIVFDFGYTNRKAVFQGDRGFSKFTYTDGEDADGKAILERSGSSLVPGGHVFRNVDFSNILGITPTMVGGQYTCDPGGINNGLRPNTGNTACLGQIVFQGDGNPKPWVGSGTNNDRYNYAPVNYLQLPQERYNAMTTFKYELTSSMEAYGHFIFASNKVPQRLAPTPAYTNITTSLDNPYMTAQTRELLAPYANTDNEVTFNLGRRMLETGPRISNTDSIAYQIKAGLRGNLVDNWDWDAYFQSGKVQVNEDIRGDISKSRFQAAANVIRGPNGNPVCKDSAFADCKPVNIFGPNKISQEGISFIAAPLNSKQDYTQNVFGASLSGDTGDFQLPGGPIGLAFGVEYREEKMSFNPSDALSRGDLEGFNQTPAVSGRFDVYDIYAELYAPILSGQPFAEILALEAAARYSTYSTNVGDVFTWKAGGEWAPVQALRFRGLYNTAVRAPNIFELFNPASNGFPQAIDPCSASQNPQAKGISALCAATGVPAAQIGTYEQRDTQIEGIYGGNPNLNEEKAKTFSIGFVLQPDFLPNFSMSVDYWNIKIDDYITSFGGGVANVLKNCYDSAVNTGLSASNPFCQVIQRDSIGQPTVSVTDQNAASLKTSGVDVQADYSFDFADFKSLNSLPGGMEIRFLGTYLQKYDFKSSQIADTNKCAGTFGKICPVSEPKPEWRHRMTFRWNYKDYGVQLHWNYIGEVKDDDPEANYAVEKIGAFNYFDLSADWQINDHFRLNGGIRNLFDKNPPIMGANAEQANTYPATYDVFGRAFYVGLRANF